MPSFIMFIGVNVLVGFFFFGLLNVFKHEEGLTYFEVFGYVFGTFGLMAYVAFMVWVTRKLIEILKDNNNE